MVQIDVALSAAVGATLANAARVQLRSEPRLFHNGPLAAATAFGSFFVLPALLFFLCTWPSWDTMYWFDRDDLPGWFVALAAVVMLAAFVLGFAAVHGMIRRGHEAAALWLPLVFLAPAGVVLAVWHDRFLHVGTRTSLAAGAPVNLLSSDVLWGLLVVIPVWVGVPLAIVVWRWARPALAELRAAKAGPHAA